VSGTTARLAVCVVLKMLAAMYHKEGKLVSEKLRRKA
jgi:hypothetical protein